MTSFTSIFVLMTALFAMAAAQDHSGYGTAYSGPHDMDATGQNMCEYNPSDLDDKWQVYYGAMNEDDWNAAGGKGGICGKCIRVEGVKGETTPGFKIKPVIVKIVDQCPSWACDKGNVDFSTTALEAITGYDWDKKLISWRYVDCDADPETGKSAEEIAAEKAAAAKAVAARKAVAAKKIAAAKEAAAARKAAAARAAAARKAAAARAAAAKKAAAEARAAAAARAAAERAAIAADVQTSTPSIAAEAENALNEVQTVASTAELVTPEVAAVAQIASVPVVTASQVVQEVAQQAEQALQATTTDQVVAQQVMATGR